MKSKSLELKVYTGKYSVSRLTTCFDRENNRKKKEGEIEVEGDSALWT